MGAPHARPRLILVRHSVPEKDPAQPAHRWPLSQAGRARCDPLADRLAACQPARLITSVEPKAMETGRRVAERLGLPCQTAAGLHEHERDDPAFLSPAEFEAGVAAFFDRPKELVWGSETAEQAGRRFSRAVHRLLAEHPDETLALVSHGRVIAAYLALSAGLRPDALWKRLGLPAFVVLSVPEGRVIEVVESVV